MNERICVKFLGQYRGLAQRVLARGSGRFSQVDMKTLSGTVHFVAVAVIAIGLILPFCFRRAYLPSTTAIGITRIRKGERATHAGGTDARSPARDCTSVVNRRGRLFKTARERAD